MKLHISTYEEYKKQWDIKLKIKWYACSFCKEKKEAIPTTLWYRSDKMIDTFNKKYNFYVFCNDACLNCYIMSKI